MAVFAWFVLVCWSFVRFYGFFAFEHVAQDCTSVIRNFVVDAVRLRKERVNENQHVRRRLEQELRETCNQINMTKSFACKKI